MTIINMFSSLKKTIPLCLSARWVKPAALSLSVIFAVTLAISALRIPVGAPAIASLTGQVKEAADPRTLDSTTTYDTNDIVQWTGTFQNPDAFGPHWQKHTLNYGANQQYISGSTKMPPGFTAKYNIGAGLSVSEPANNTVIQAAEFQYAPKSATFTQAPLAVLGYVGGADGFNVITYEGNIYVVHHHAVTEHVQCFSDSVGTACSGWLTGVGRGVPGTQTSNVPFEHLDRATGELYYPVAIDAGGKLGFACFNLKTQSPCAISIFPMAAAKTSGFYRYTDISGIGGIGNKIYAVGYNGEIYCLNTTTKLKCNVATDKPGTYQLPGSPAISTSEATTISAPYIFISSDGGATKKLHCFNTDTASPCTGSWPITHSRPNNAARLITDTSNGALKALCIANASGLNDCFTPTGAPYTRTALESGIPTTQGGVAGKYYGDASYLRELTHKNRIYSLQKESDGFDNILCYDLTTGSACAGFNATAKSRSLVRDVYTITVDTERPNCLWANSDPYKIVSFSSETGGDCTPGEGLIKIDANPAESYKCDPSALSSVTGWDAVVFSGISWTNLTKVEVILKNADTSAQIGAPRLFANGTYALDLSDVNYAANPKLKVDIKFTSTSGTFTAYGDVLHKGPAPQFCHKVKLGTDCLASAKLTASSTVDPTLSYTQLVPLNKVLVKDQARRGFGAGSAVSSTEIINKPLIFRGTFDEVTLSGDMTVARYEYKPADSPPTLGPGAVLVSASSLGVTPSPNSRNVITQLPPSSPTSYTITDSVGFEWNKLDVTQQNLLSRPAPGDANLALNATFGKKRLNYLRGDSGDEIINGGLLRSRSGTARTMGMVLGSSLVYLPTYGSMGYSEVTQPGYSAFARATGRTKPTVFVNANDGMLHAYKIDDQGGTNVTMTEQFAYLPRSLLAKMPDYTDKTNAALVKDPYFNDSTPMVADIKLNNTWSTVLASTFGRGAKGLYMLNVTKADAVTQSNPQNLAIREFTEANDVDMGYIVSQPAVNDLNLSSQIVQVKTSSGLRPAVIVGNGMNSTNGVAALFIIYLDTEGGYLKIPMPATAIAGVANGLSTPRVLTSAVAGVADRVYVGDLYGNMWAIDISNLSTVPTPYLLFNTGVDTNGKPLPIATAPTAMLFNPANTTCANCWMVNFATGKPTTGVLLYDTDIPKQTAYGIWDKGAGAAVLKTKLVEQVIDVTTVQGSTVKNRAVDYTSVNVLGWYMALPNGQMAVANPFLRPNGTFVMFTIKQVFAIMGTCTAGDGDVYEVISSSGNTMTQTIDINGDLKINDSDLITVTDPGGDTKAASATKSVGEAQRGATQVVQLTPGSGLESKAMSSGNSVIEGSAFGTGPKRISWREIVN